MLYGIELLLNVNQLSFAAHELNLYLDIYPNDTQMIELFNHYRSMANEAIERYEKKENKRNSTRDILNKFKVKVKNTVVKDKVKEKHQQQER